MDQETAGFDLDDRLTQGRTLQNREIESLARSFRGAGAQELDTGAFDQHLAILEDFLKWSLDSENRGGRRSLGLAELAQERNRIGLILRSLRSGARAADRIEPLEEAEIQMIRQRIGPRRDAHGLLSFPKIFSPHTQLRNWLMFEVALELGIRRGELLKLRLDSLPRGADDGIRILRRPDDPHDSRSKEPAVKTAERVIPASRNLLASIRAYLTYPPPVGRVSGRTPYLFVARSGSPVSMDTADDVIAAIGEHSGVSPLSWHRLRHTWAERMTEAFADQPNGMDRLVYLGGWTNPPEQALAAARLQAANGASIYKYGFNEDINVAERRQREHALLSGPEIEKRFFESQLDQLKTELEKERERNRQLVASIAVIEANAGRLGIDPEELYRAVLKPLRSMSRAGSNMNGTRRRFRRS